MEIVRRHAELAPSKVTNCLCYLTVCGNVIEVKQMTSRNTKQNIQFLENTDFYQVLRTGEVKEKKINEKRVDDTKELRRTFKDLRDIINTNVVDVSFCRWVTLTYAENMTDFKRLYKDFDKFIKRFKYFCSSKGYGHFEYINAVEPQSRGAWHCHLLFIFDSKAPYIANKDLKDLWSFGFVTVKRLSGDVDNVGAYLTSYLTDLELDHIDKKNDFDKNVKNVNGKKYKKGARLHLYPANMRIYRTSRGIKKPIKIVMTPNELKKYIGSYEPTYQKLIELLDDDFQSFIFTRYYNLKRK